MFCSIDRTEYANCIIGKSVIPLPGSAQSCQCSESITWVGNMADGCWFYGDDFSNQSGIEKSACHDLCRATTIPVSYFILLLYYVTLIPCYFYTMLLL